MLRKTLAISLASTALVLGSTSLAFAYDFHRGGRDMGSSFEISVQNEDTNVQNYASATSNTGNNDQEVESHRTTARRGSSVSQNMTTGDAGSDALADATVNDTYIESDCGCLDGGRSRSSVRSSIGVENEDTYVMNGADAGAGSGNNEQEVEGSRRGTSTQTMRTGNATSVSTAMARVNMSDIRVSR